VSGAPAVGYELEMLVYTVCEAKFWAERAHGVGPSSIVGMLRKGQPLSIFNDEDIRQLKAIWESYASRLSGGAQAHIKMFLKKDNT
jgi:hypothetical protein